MSGLDATQVERLRQIGEYLGRQREAQKTSLEKIAKQTFIPQRLLEALEAGEIERLPEPVYVKGFIRRYADAIGLDGVEIADAFELPPMYPAAAPAEAPEPPAAEPAAPAPVAQTVTPAATARTRVAPTGSQPPVPSSTAYGNGRSYPNGQTAAPRATTPQAKQTNPEPRASIPTLERDSVPLTTANPRPVAPIAWIGLAALAAVGAIALIVNAMKPAAEPGTPAAPASSAPANPTTATAPSPAPTSSPSPATPATTAPVQVEIKATEDTWLSVVADDNTEPEFEGMMAKGKTMTWTATDRLSIRAGNAGGIEVSHNHSPAKTLGAAGEVVDVTFTEEPTAGLAPTNETPASTTQPNEAQ